MNRSVLVQGFDTPSESDPVPLNFRTDRVPQRDRASWKDQAPWRDWAPWRDHVIKACESTEEDANLVFLHLMLAADGAHLQVGHFLVQRGDLCCLAVCKRNGYNRLSWIFFILKLYSLTFRHLWILML